MSGKSNVVVLGGGAIGICCAYYLWKNGHKVTVLEKDEIGAGCSYGNAGLVTPSHFIPLAAPGVVAQGIKWMFNPESPFYIRPRFDLELFSWMWKFYRCGNEKHVQNSVQLLRDLSLSSIALYDDLAGLSGLDFGLEHRGLLMLYKQEEGYKECQKTVEMAGNIGIDARMLNPGEIRELDPALQTSAEGGAYFSQDLHLTPSLFVQQLTRFLEKNGVEMFPGTAVLGLETHRGQITGVRTSSGDYSADEFVLAGGAWSPLLLRELRNRLPLQPAKGYSITAILKEKLPSIPLILTEKKIAVTPMGNELRFSGTLELAGLDLSINQRRVDAILKGVPKYLPLFDLANHRKAQPWSGLRPCSPDGLPYLGRFSNYENLVAATGHAMIGISLAPVTGKLVAEIIAGQRTSINISLLAPERFGN